MQVENVQSVLALTSPPHPSSVSYAFLLPFPHRDCEQQTTIQQRHLMTPSWFSTMKAAAPPPDLLVLSIPLALRIRTLST